MREVTTSGAANFGVLLDVCITMGKYYFINFLEIIMS
jgi:hypothetical protein